MDCASFFFVVFYFVRRYDHLVALSECVPRMNTWWCSQCSPHMGLPHSCAYLHKQLPPLTRGTAEASKTRAKHRRWSGRNAQSRSLAPQEIHNHWRYVVLTLKALSFIAGPATCCMRIAGCRRRRSGHNSSLIQLADRECILGINMVFLKWCYRFIDTKHQKEFNWNT